VPLDNDRLPFHHPPEVSGLQREMSLYGANDQSWYRPDRMALSTVNSEGQLGSIAANLQVYPSTSNLRSTPLYTINDSLLDDAVRLQYPSDPYAHSLNDYQNYHYPSTGADMAIEPAQQDPCNHPDYGGHKQPTMQQQGVRVNDAYGLWSDIPNVLELDAWENHVSHINYMADGHHEPAREQPR